MCLQVDSLKAINLRVDEKCDLLISSLNAMDEAMEVRLSVFADAIVARLEAKLTVSSTDTAAAVKRLSTHSEAGSDDANSSATVPLSGRRDSTSSTTSISDSSNSALVPAFSVNGYSGGSEATEAGPPLSSADLATLQQTLARLQIEWSSMSYAQKAPIGSGGFAKVSHSLCFPTVVCNGCQRLWSMHIFCMLCSASSSLEHHTS
jgi:hypothetical protein